MFCNRSAALSACRASHRWAKPGARHENRHSVAAACEPANLAEDRFSVVRRHAKPLRYIKPAQKHACRVRPGLRREQQPECRVFAVVPPGSSAPCGRSTCKPAHRARFQATPVVCRSAPGSAQTSAAVRARSIRRCCSARLSDRTSGSSRCRSSINCNRLLKKPRHSRLPVWSGRQPRGSPRCCAARRVNGPADDAPRVDQALSWSPGNGETGPASIGHVGNITRTDDALLSGPWSQIHRRLKLLGAEAIGGFARHVQTTDPVALTKP